MYKSLNFHTINEVSQKLRISEEIIINLIERKLLEAVTIADTGIWIIEEKAILEFIAKGNNFKNDYDVDDVKIELVNNKITEISKDNSSNTVNDNNKLKTIESIRTKKLSLKENINEVNPTNHNKLNIEIDAANLSGEELIIRIIEALRTVDVLSINKISTQKEDNIANSNINNIPKEKNIELDVVNLSKKIDINSKIISKSDIVKHKDGDYIASNKFINEEDVIAEFIFDKEQAKKPISEEIVFYKLGLEDNVHICDDQEANQKLLNKYNKSNGV